MRMHRLLLGLLVAALLGSASPARADDRLAEALRLYDAATYTRALEVLDQLTISEPSPRVHQYRALCLIALGRPDAAERAMADIVAADPFFALEAEAASPRIAAQFASVRRRLLPPLIRRGFADATAQYREGATARARQRFDDVLRLLDDPSLQADQSLADLALVAGAFVELTKAQTPPSSIAVISRPIVVAPAPPAASSSAVVASAPGPMRVTASAPAAFEPAVAMVRPLPRWTPPDPRAATRAYSGAIALEVDANGRVVAAASKKTIHPAYDPVVLAAARQWVFQPARQNGHPIKSEITVEIELLPSPQ